jgi:hypothetical protein
MFVEYHGKKYRRVEIECDAPPTTRLCGTEEYDEKEECECKRRSPCKYKPTREEIQYLYYKKELSLRGMAAVAEKYFGEPISEWRFTALMKEYGLKRRPAKGGVQQTKGQQKVAAILNGR